VKVRTRREEPERKAAKGDNLFAGARVVVGEGASAEATLREVGRLKIGESTEILVPTHGRCGAIVVRGSAHLEGTKMNRRRSRCYLHTSAASFWAPRAEAAVAAAPDGRARLIAITGGVSRVDVDDSAVEIAPATATTFEWNGEPGPSKAIDPVAMDAEEDLAKWLAGIGAMKPSDADERAGKMLDEADGIAALLEKDVSALESTAESIRTRRKEYMETAKDPATGEDRMADLKRALSHTTDEKLALLGRGAQKIHRIAALCAAAASIGSTDAAIAERAEALRGEVGALVPRAPRMFEKAHKGSSRNRILQRMSRYRPIKAD